MTVKSDFSAFILDYFIISYPEIGPSFFFLKFTPVLTHPKDFNKMKVKDAIISYALVKSKVNVKCEDRIMQEDQKYQIPTGKKASILFFLS